MLLKQTNNPTEDGVVATGAVGSVGSSRTVAITGVQARGQVGTVDKFYWSVIDDSQTPAWGLINASQTPTWGLIDAEQTPDWQDVEMTV